MKPHGPIPPGFRADASGMLLIGGDRADALVDAAGDTPPFVYYSAMLTARVAEWRAPMPTALQLQYSLKSTPYTPLLPLLAWLIHRFIVHPAGRHHNAHTT